MKADLDDRTALMVVDAQKGIDVPGHWGKARNNPQAEDNIKRLLESWQSRRWPVFYSVHDSLEPQSPLKLSLPTGEIKEGLEPQAGEPVIRKDVNSAFIGTDLELQLRRRRIDKLVIVGFFTNHCVEATTRMAGNLGYGTMLVSDATATYDRTGPDGRTFDADLVHAVSLASMNGEFAEVLSTEELLADA